MGWFVTKDEPTADQRQIVQEVGKGQIRAVSFSQFQQSIVDVRGYLAARKEHSFGSVQDFSTGAKSPEIPFVEIGLTDVESGTSKFASDVVDIVIAGGHIAIEGQYGAGKSMTLREIFLRLVQRYISGGTRKFPVYINLREHSAQNDPVEILERHARGIGFESPASLVRAWRAGFAILLIDGFDEVASFGVQGAWKKLKDLRMRSLGGVRKLIRESSESGVAVCGRSNYFETRNELANALGLRSPKLFSLDEFTEDQMRDFLSRFSSALGGAALPAWLPTRPLLLGYLASHELLGELRNQNGTPDVVDGWDYLLDRIYQREERIETNLDGVTLRLILERASTMARNSESGLGPISRSDLFSVFKEVCGYEPDEQGILAIQRLPGLGIYQAEDESRCFVDKELAEVCRGKELARFLLSPYDAEKDSIWVEVMENCDRPIGKISCELAYRKLRDNGDADGLIRNAVNFLNSRSASLPCAKGDVAVMLLHGGPDLTVAYPVSGMSFYGEIIEFGRDDPDRRQLRFVNCLFERVQLEPGVDSEKLPVFDGCLFDEISGRASRDDLPSDKFLASCDFAAFDAMGTSGAIRAATMSVGQKVLLIALRKLFVQSLSGRAEGALYRGLDVDERRCVSDVLRLLKRHHLAMEYSRGDGVVWLPVRKALSRVKRILSAPNECGESIVAEARSL